MMKFNLTLRGKTTEGISASITLPTGSELSQNAGNTIAKLYDKVTTNSVTEFDITKKITYEVADNGI